MAGSVQEDRLERVGLVFLGMVVVLAPLPMGSVHWQAALVWAVFSSLSALCVSVSRWRAGKRIRCSVLSMVMGVGVFWTTLQWLPWPSGLVKWLSPERARLQSLVIEHGLVQDSFWLVPSLDPGATADMTLRFLALWAAVWTVENLSVRRRQGNVLPMIVGSAVLGSLAVGVLQRGMGSELFLWFYEAERAPTLGSTFVNGNQSAALAALGVCVWLMLAMARGIKRQRFRLIFVLCALVCLGGVALQSSLGVWLVLVVSVFGAATYYGALRRGMLEGARVRAALVSLVSMGWVTAWGVALALGGDGRESLATRVEMAGAALSASLNYPLLGSGAWSVERVLAPYLNWELLGQTRVETVEAELLEWTLTLGWPMTLLIWTGLLWAWAGPLFVAKRRARRAAAMYGAGLFIMSMAQLHFPFFMVGLGLPMIVAWASVRERVLVSRKPRLSDEERVETPTPPSRGRWLKVGGSLSRRAVVVCGVFLLVALFGSVYRVASSPGRVFHEQIDAMTHERVLETAALMPSESQLYVRHATSEPLDDDLEAQHELFVVAYELEPTLPYEVLLARASWRAGERDAARERWTKVLLVEGYSAYRRGLAAMLETVQESEERARIVKPGEQVLWEKTWRLIDKVEGEIRAQEFLQAITDQNPSSVHAHELLVNFYIEKQRWELLGMYTQLLMMWDFDEPEQGQELLWRARISMWRAQRKPELIIRALTSQIELFSSSPELAVHLMTHAPELLASADHATYRPHLERAHALVCKGHLRVTWRDACELYKAHLFELDGEFERAEQLWRQRAQRQGYWADVGAYYERQGQCTALGLLLKQASQGVLTPANSKSTQKSKAVRSRLVKALEAQHRRCVTIP